VGGCGLDSIGPGQRPVAGSSEPSSETPCFIMGM
jgi:hypothetical protein